MVNKMVVQNTIEKDNGQECWLKVTIVLSLFFLITYIFLIPLIELFDEFEDPFDDILKDTIPNVQDLFHKQQHTRNNAFNLLENKKVLTTKQGNFFCPTD
jgi:hypothetical protein